MNAAQQYYAKYVDTPALLTPRGFDWQPVSASLVPVQVDHEECRHCAGTGSEKHIISSHVNSRAII